MNKVAMCYNMRLYVILFYVVPDWNVKERSFLLYYFDLFRHANIMSPKKRGILRTDINHCNGVLHCFNVCFYNDVHTLGEKQ